MAIRAEVEVARADMNDEYGVSVWQRRKLVDYTVEDARAFADEILHAADEAERVALEDRDASYGYVVGYRRRVDPIDAGHFGGVL